MKQTPEDRAVVPPVRLRPGDRVLDEHLEGLPEPVRRFLTYAGLPGTTVPARFRITQKGRLRRDPNARWWPVTALQTYCLEPPGFVWEGTARIAPFIHLRGTDTLSHGRGRMIFKLFGLFTPIDAAGPEIDQATVMRYLNETMWFPWAMLTCPITWEAVDDTHAKATITVRNVTESASYTFDDEGRLLDFTALRYMSVGHEFRLRPWSTPVGDYGTLGGLRVPVTGSAVWHLDDGDFTAIELRVSDGFAER